MDLEPYTSQQAAGMMLRHTGIVVTQEESERLAICLNYAMRHAIERAGDECHRSASNLLMHAARLTNGPRRHETP